MSLSLNQHKPVLTYLIMALIILAFLAGAPAARSFADSGPIPSADGYLPSAEDYAVTYYPNGATGGTVPVDTGSYASGDTLTVAGNSGNLVKTDYTFGGWKDADTLYQPGDTVEISGDVALSAVWVETYTVTYDGNGATSGTVPTDDNHYTNGVFVTVSGSTGDLASSTNGFFSGWNTAANGSGTPLAPGDTFRMGTVNLTLYAQYSMNVNYHTLTYDGNGNTDGGIPDGVTVVVNGSESSTGYATVSGNTGGLVRTDHYFSGWNTRADGTGTTYQPTEIFFLSADLTLYAHWRPFCTVTYDNNGSTRGADNLPVDLARYVAGSTATVKWASCSLGQINGDWYSFFGWNTRADGTGRDYQPYSNMIVTDDVTLYATWVDPRSNPTQSKFYIHYDGNRNTGGSVPVDPTGYFQYHMVTVLDPGDMAKTGYRFDGWTYLSWRDGQIYTLQPEYQFQIDYGDMKLSALWVPEPHTITYDGNGATGGAAPDASGGYYPGEPARVSGNTGNLEKTNHTFSGWNTQADGKGQTYPPDSTLTMETADIPLYARWTPVRHAVTYDGNKHIQGSAPVDTASPYIPGALVTVTGNTGNLVRLDCVFSGWNTAADGTGTTYSPGDTFFMGIEDATLYALWVPGRIVVYDGNGNTQGDVPEDLAGYLPGDTVTVSGNTGGLSGGTGGTFFAGWNTGADGTGTAYQAGDTLTMGEDDIRLYAVYTTVLIEPPPQSVVDDQPDVPVVTVQPPPPLISVGYTITFCGNGNDGGTVPNGQSHFNGAQVTMPGPGDLYKDGYEFKGWTDGYATYPEDASFTMPSRYVVLAAVWGPPSYVMESNRLTHTVNYNGNWATGGSVPKDANTYSIQFSDYVTVLGPGNLYKEGCNFIAWNTDAHGNGTPYQAGDIFLYTGPVTLYAMWDPGTYQVSYRAIPIPPYTIGGAMPSDPVWYRAGDTVTIGDETPTCGPYYFGGWNTLDQSGLLYQPGDAFQIGNNTTLSALFLNVPTYFVHYAGNGSAGGVAPVDAPHLTFGYQTGDTVPVTGSASLVAPAGRYFAGWNTRADGTGTAYLPGDTFPMGTDDVTLHATWTLFPGRFSVCYDGNTADTGAVPADTHAYGKSYTVTVLGNTGGLAKTDHVFGGWNTRADGTGTAHHPGGTFVMGSDNVTLYAMWDLGHGVFYDGNGAGEGIVPVDFNGYLPGEAVTVSGNTGNLAKPGAILQGWAVGGTLYQPGDTFGMASDSVTLYAVWTYLATPYMPPSYTVTYDGNGSTGGTVPVDSDTYQIGTDVTVSGNTGNLVKTGFIFSGWNNRDRTYQQGDTLMMGSAGAANMVLSAVWQPAFTVAYDPNGNTGGTPPVDLAGYRTGDTVTVSGNTGNLIKEEHRFAGWWVDGCLLLPGETFIMGTVNVTASAVWAERSTWGDINKDGDVDLTDAIVCLQVLTGVQPVQTVYRVGDINGNNRIGIEEAVYILREVAGVQ